MASCKYRLIELKHILKEHVLVRKIASRSKALGKPAAGRPVYVAMVDGSAKHGGMCDRFKGMITLYAYCRHRGCRSE